MYKWEKQKRYLKTNESILSPTVSLEVLSGTLIIDVYEERDVAIFEVLGLYLHAEIPKDKHVLMKFRGKFVEIMCQVNPEYSQYILQEKGKKVLCVRILQAFYGYIKSTLLWYELYVGTLQKMSYIINPYDKYVANCVVNRK